MEALTFDKMPWAISQLYEKIECIERLLQQKLESPAPITDRYFDVAETGKFLRISKARVYTKHSNGELPGMKFGNRLHFSEKDLIALLQTGRKKTFTEIANEADLHLLKLKNKRN